MPASYDHDHEQEITLFGETNFRNQRRRFGIKTDDRRRHVYVLGKTGMGKTTLLENMVLSDIYAGHGVAYIDPHGDTAEKLLDYIPPHRINDVVYFNPADMAFPVGFNILETVNEEQKHLVGSGLMGVFKKIWPDVWSPRMEYILLNCVLALLDYPGATLLGINRLLVDKEYRTRVIAKLRDPIVKTFWVAEFTSWSEKYATEAIAPVQNKVGQFLSASIIRNIVAQVKSTIDPRRIMDEQKIFIVNLSKGKIGEDNMRLLGGMIVTKLQLAAMERVDMPEAERKDFYLCVDEFQNFANESFASILSEARKYRLNLTVAHQYIEQLDETVRDAIFGNVGTMIMFRVGAPDAQFLETEFTPTFIPEDLTNLTKFQVYLKLMVDGVATQPFSANTLPPIAQRTDSLEKVVAVSRERYAESRNVIEDKVLRWSGMEAAGSVQKAVEDLVMPPGAPAVMQYPKIETEEEKESADAAALTQPSSASEAREALGGTPASMTPGTPEYAEAGRRALEGDDGDEEGGVEEYLKISPERLAAISKPSQQPKKEKPKFKHTCTRCGKAWEMPIQLDPSRPMYCAECMPIVREERKTKEEVVKTGPRAKPTRDMGPAPAREDRPSPPRDRLEQTMRAAEEGSFVRDSAHAKSQTNNRPRLVLTDKETLAALEDKEEDDPSDLVRDIERTTGKQMERRKQAVTPPLEERPQPKAEVPRTSEPREHQKSKKRKRSHTRRNDSGGTQPPRGTSGRSLEDVFRNAEEGGKPLQTIRPSNNDQASTVFRPAPSRGVDDAQGGVRVAPGQRVRF